MAALFSTAPKTVSDSTLIRDMKLMHDGFIGTIVEFARLCLQKRKSWLDWPWQARPCAGVSRLDIVARPSPDHPFMINSDRKKPGLYVHYDWHYFWEYGNGEIGNQGVHQMDEAVWGHNRACPFASTAPVAASALMTMGKLPTRRRPHSLTRTARSLPSTFAILVHSRKVPLEIAQQLLWHQGILCPR